MSTLAFAVVAFMLTLYVVLDGYDLGVAAITPIIARTDAEREGSMRAIGPFWNGNEVWLIAAGGALFALFPQAYASAFSGFYLPFMVVLWLLMFRGVALELRGHFPSEIWHTFWDAAFCVASALLVVIFGVALGNLVRGVPLDAQGYFQGTFAYLLNPYALLVGVFALAVLAQHGLTFVLARVEGEPARRSRGLLVPLWFAVLGLYLLTSAATLLMRGAPHLAWTVVLPPITIASLAAVWIFAVRSRGWAAFAASSLAVATLLVQAAATIYPYVLPGVGAVGGLSIDAATPSPTALGSALVVTIAGIVAVLVYGTVVLPKMAGKVRIPE